VAKRIHQLAKELGVKSTAVVKKCQAEGLDVKNHMSTLSAGLEGTIREWFSAGEHTTTVEATAYVDLEKVKTKPRRSRKKKPEAVKTESESVVDMAEAPAAIKAEAKAEEITEVVKEEKAVAVKSRKKAQKPVKPKRISPKEIEAGQPEQEHAEVSIEEPLTTVKEEDTPSPATPEIQPGPIVVGKIEPASKDPVKMDPIPYVPKPAVLQGPKVIRTEPVVTRRPTRKPSSSLRVSSISPPPAEEEAKTGKSGRRRRKRHTSEGESEGEARRTKLRPQKRQKHLSLDRRAESEGQHEWGNIDLLERQERLAGASSKKLHSRERRLQQEEAGGGTGLIAPHRIEKAEVKEPITVKELSSAIGVRATEIMGKLMSMGIMATINQTIDADAAATISLDFGVELVIKEKTLLLDDLQKKFDEEVPEEELSARPPVVTFLGHVDHGKTSLLDRIRQSAVASDEAGGITQHIGSYLYDDGNRQVTFLDTPGHKAFTEMRARGANMTDVVVLVVAADDGVMPQTEEAINHARAAKVPIVVALNKIDVPNADVNRALGQLAEKDLVPAEWGGETEVVKTSAETGEGIGDLVEHLEYISELCQLKVKDTGPATGWIVESELTAQQGITARLLVKSGLLKQGDVIVSGCSYGKVRTMVDSQGNNIAESGPATPLEVTGLDEVPEAGNRFYVVDNISKAAEIAEEQRTKQREKTLARRRQVTLENLFSEIAAGELREFNVILRADVQGSVDVLCNTLTELNTNEVAVRILHAAVGGITESDVLLAQASNAIIIGFQVIADEHARKLAEKEGVEIRLYRVIYQISDDIKHALEGMLKPRIEEKTLGQAEVRRIFRISRIGVIAGCYVLEGVISRSARVRLIRDSVIIRDDTPIESLKREKNDTSEVRNGLECGIKLAGFDDLKVGDIIEAYEKVEISRSLDSPNPAGPGTK